MTNGEMLDWLFEEGKIDIARGAVFDKPPEPFPGGVDFGRVEGMMLALAVGDSLGATTEGALPEARRKRGEIRDYVKNRHAKDSRGYPSDDTQLSFWTLEQLNEDGGFVPENVAKCLYQNTIYGIGGNVSDFIANHKAGKPWYEAGPKSAGNGALMRIAPMLIPHLKSPSPELWVDTALSAMITHNDSASIASCLAFVNILWELLHMDGVPEPSWWLDAFTEVAGDLEKDAYEPGGPFFKGREWSLCDFLREKLPDAYEKGQSTFEACQSWYSSAYLMETVPCVLYILMKHGDDLEEAVVRAVNDTMDNDTVAAIVGAAVGALYGSKAIPGRWLDNLCGCTRIENGEVLDEGQVHKVLEESRRLWG